MYRKAAEYIFDNATPLPYTLRVLTKTPFMEDVPEVDACREMYMTDTNALWPWQEPGLTNSERNHLRVLALCFMAAMVEAGDV